MKQHKLLIVDAMSGGRFFPEIAKRQFSAECFHLLSSESLPDYYKTAFKQEQFSKCLTWSEDKHNDLVKLFLREQITAVIAGTETGVELADRLSFELGLITNGIDLSRARRSKTLMHKVAFQNGLRIPLQMAIASIEEGLSFISKNLKYPIVVKPDDSAGTDGFYLVDTEDEFKKAFSELYNKTNKLGSLNSKVIIQEFIKGEEFAVNTISVDGKHFVTHIWQYHKKIIGSVKIYDWEEYISSKSALGQQITIFTEKTLDSLGIKFGAAHTEVMLDDKGLVLIESASRVDGMCNPNVDNECLGINQVHLSLLSYLEPKNVESFLSKNFKSQGVLANISMISKSASDKPVNKINLNLLHEVESFKDIRLSIKVGDPLTTTVDIFTSPGFIYMYNQSIDLIKRDYLKIRDLEDHNKIFQTF